MRETGSSFFSRYITLCILFFFHVLLSSADFFQNNLFQKDLSRTLSEYQMIWIQIRTDTLFANVIISRQQKTPKVYKQFGEQTAFVLNGGKRFNTPQYYFLNVCLAGFWGGGQCRESARLEIERSLVQAKYRRHILHYVLEVLDSSREKPIR